MKSEERHELQENELAGWIYHVPALLNKYGSHLLFAVALIILAFQGYAWYQRSQDAKREKAWGDLAEASVPEAVNPPLKLQNLMTTCDIKPVQAMAAVALGDFYLITLTQGEPPKGSQVTVTSDEADVAAEKAYRSVLEGYPEQELAVVRARLGLGKLYENRRQWDKAAAEYETIKKLGTPSAKAFVVYVEARLNRLKEWAEPVTFGPPATLPALPPEPTLGPPLPPASTPPR